MRFLLVALLALIVLIIVVVAGTVRKGTYGRGVVASLASTMLIAVPVFALSIIILLYSDLVASAPDEVVSQAEPIASDEAGSPEDPADSDEAASQSESGTATTESELDKLDILAAAASVSFVAWVLAALVMGFSATPERGARTAYAKLKTDYRQLAKVPNATPVTVTAPDPNALAAQAVVLTAIPTVVMPLSRDTFDGYLTRLNSELLFEEPLVKSKTDPANWNNGVGYLEAQRQLDYARDSIITWRTSLSSLLATANQLDLRLTGARLPDGSKKALTEQLMIVKTKLDPEPASGAQERYNAQAGPLYIIAASLSAFTYDTQRALLQLRARMHWLVVVLQVISAAILAIAVLAGASAEAIAAAGAFFVLGALAGITSLVSLRASETDDGEDYGLYRIEIARAVMLSGMAAVLAVFLTANLSNLVNSNAFEPVAPTTQPVTEVPPVDATSTATELPPEDATQPALATPSSSSPELARNALAVAPVAASLEGGPRTGMRSFLQTVAMPDSDETDQDASETDTSVDIEWFTFPEMFNFEHYAGFLIAILAGWVPERLFRSLTDYGNRLRLDVQSVRSTAR